MLNKAFLKNKRFLFPPHPNSLKELGGKKALPRPEGVSQTRNVLQHLEPNLAQGRCSINKRLMNEYTKGVQTSGAGKVAHVPSGVSGGSGTWSWLPPFLFLVFLSLDDSDGSEHVLRACCVPRHGAKHFVTLS